jgi:hypothetical protein
MEFVFSTCVKYKDARWRGLQISRVAETKEATSYRDVSQTAITERNEEYISNVSLLSTSRKMSSLVSFRHP